VERSRKDFRWKEVYLRAELEAVVRRKTGVDLGTLFEIVPVRRGVSGRIIELELIGSRHNLRLQKELKIREALATGRLSSSCFTVHAELDGEGLPRRFTLLGAGHGHGCGLCQVGAGALAERGADCRAILGHYFPGAELARLYAPA
jgi:SpoIID/LytB domain protein